MGRKYFGRLWVYQELMLGKRVMLCCGEDTLSVKALSAFAACLSWPCNEVLLRKIRDTECICILELLKNVVRTTPLLKDAALVQPPDRYLDQVVENFSVWDLDCSDNRDKVYGILSVVNCWKRVSIQADYKMSTFELCVKAIMEINPVAFYDIEFMVLYLRLDSNLSPADLEASAWSQRIYLFLPLWNSEIACTDSYERFLETSGEKVGW